MDINWNCIRTLNGTQNGGFEELVCQLARHEDIPEGKDFFRKGIPDAGVECYLVLNSGDECAWQAKFFTASIGTSQWQQIDRSVKTTLKCHKRLIKYIIAIPNDPSDAREKGQISMLDKWNKHVQKWKKWALDDLKHDVDFVPWWSSDLIDRLQKPENVGMTYFWFNKDEFTDKWFKDKIESSIYDIGKRYTPNLNLNLDIAKVFNGISRNVYFVNKIDSLFNDVFVKIKHISLNKIRLDDYEKFNSLLNYFSDMFKQTSFNGIGRLPFNDFIKTLNEINECIDKYCSERGSLYDIKNSINTFIEYINGTICKLANNPYLLLEGNAGVGKSHLLADIVSNRTKSGQISLFFLGQHFVTKEDPWTQMFKMNNIRCTREEFLEALNIIAHIHNERVIIFIDAVNEGKGKLFWPAYIRSFLKKIKEYDGLGIVFSIRTSYSELIFPEDEFNSENLVRCTHYGFGNQSYEAIKMFFNEYKIQLPTIPLLNPEFKNPLFLKLFCESLNKSGYHNIPKKLKGTSSIFDFYINVINKYLARPERLYYCSSINIVRKSIEALVRYKIENDLNYISCEDACIILNKELSNYGVIGNLLDELISEGVLSKNIFYHKEEGIYITYERLEDYISAEVLLNKNTNIEEAFKESGDIYPFIKNGSIRSFNTGIIEALSIQIPEQKGKELFEYLPDNIRKDYLIAECCVKSLLWRKNNIVTEQLRNYINKIILHYKGTFDLFWETIITLSPIPKNEFNAYTLHEYLMRCSMSKRDSWWNVFLFEHYDESSVISQLIDWAWNTNDKSYISDESIKLTSITLAWFLTSTNRRLRDSSTKALICLLYDNIHILIEILEIFEKVNDPYVYERLFAVAYGCVVRTKQIDALPKLCNYIYNTIFNAKKEVYPHILLRDYARNVIEYANFKGVELDIDLLKIRPPYKSSFPKRLPSDEEIEKLFDPGEDGNWGKKKWGTSAILMSMVTEHSKKKMYGDFGRYVFEYAFRNWKIDANKLSNLAIKFIFEKYGYNPILHSDFDSKIGDGRARGTTPNERIGKKYQWIAFYELLARVSDNIPKYADWDSKKVDAYIGTCVPYVRDIDPTILIKKTGDVDPQNKNIFWWAPEQYLWNKTDKGWLNKTKDLPSFNNIINIKDETHSEWLVMEGYPEWKEPESIGNNKGDYPRRNIWYQIRSYLVLEKDYDNVIRWGKGENFTGRWMSESHDTYEMFSREYYWSPAYNYFSDKPYYESIEDEDINDRSTGKHIGKIKLTTHSFLWEEEFDASKEQNIRFLKPSNCLFKGLKMQYSQKEGEYINSNNKRICFDPSVYNNTESYLLIKKSPLLSFLKNNHLKIFWIVIGEKDIEGGQYQLSKLDISGLYYLNEENEIAGNIKTKHE